MKKLMLLLLSIIFILGSCTKETHQQDINTNIQNEFRQKIRPLFGVTLRIQWGKFHRPKEEPTNSGKVCRCEICFGLCDWGIFTNKPVGFDPAVVVEIDGENHLYILEKIDHIEDIFYVDEEIVVYLNKEEEFIQKTILPGEYEVEFAGVHYEQYEDLETFARIKVNLE